MTDGTMTLHGTPPAHGETMTLHEMDTTGYYWDESTGSLLYRSDTGDTILDGHRGRYAELEECSTLEEAEDTARLWAQRALGTTTPSRCIQVRRSDTGTYEIPGAATEEVWQEVRSHMEEVEHHGDLCGWKPWTRVYRCVDEHGDTRWYFVQ